MAKSSKTEIAKKGVKAAGNVKTGMTIGGIIGGLLGGPAGAEVGGIAGAAVAGGVTGFTMTDESLASEMIGKTVGLVDTSCEYVTTDGQTVPKGLVKNPKGFKVVDSSKNMVLILGRYNGKSYTVKINHNRVKEQ